MNPVQSVDDALALDVEEVRRRFTNTQDIYREVCALLFFRYGLTPTANRLYQLVRKGSMSAPAEALAQFWADLREKSRTRIEHPDLPDELTSLGGELIAQIWITAQHAAKGSLDVYRQDADKEVTDARAIAEAAQADCDAHRAHATAAQEALVAAQEQIGRYREHIAALDTARQQLALALEEKKNENSVLQANLEGSRREFAHELDGLREAMQRTEDRSRAIERRMLIDIDRERVAANQLQKDLDALRSKTVNDMQMHSDALQTIQDSLVKSRQEYSEVSQQLRTAQERLASVVSEKEQLFAELLAVRSTEAALRKHLMDQQRRQRPALTSSLRKRGPRRRASNRAAVQLVDDESGQK